MSFLRSRERRGYLVGWSGRGGWYRRGWCRGLMGGGRFVSRVLRGWARFWLLGRWDFVRRGGVVGGVRCLWCLGRWYLIGRGGIVRGRMCRLMRWCLWCRMVMGGCWVWGWIGGG